MNDLTRQWMMEMASLCKLPYLCGLSYADLSC